MTLRSLGRAAAAATGAAAIGLGSVADTPRRGAGRQALRGGQRGCRPHRGSRVLGCDRAGIVVRGGCGGVHARGVGPALGGLAGVGRSGQRRGSWDKPRRSSSIARVRTRPMPRRPGSWSRRRVERHGPAVIPRCSPPSPWLRPASCARRLLRVAWWPRWGPRWPRRVSTSGCTIRPTSRVEC